MGESGRHVVRRVDLVAPLRRADSGAAAFLGLASDGATYWMKAPNGPQGARTLITEHVVARLGTLLQVPVPETVLVDLPADLHYEIAPGIRLHGGIAHGSAHIDSVVVNFDWGTFSADDHNRHRQAAILALWDLCLGEDPQWLQQSDDDMSAWTFDHGLWFGGGADWTLDDLRRVGTQPWDGDLDAGVCSAEALRHVADRLDRLQLSDVQAVTAEVPVQWDTTPEEMSALASILFVRAEGVADRLRTAAHHTRHA